MIFSQVILQATTTDLTPILSTLGIPVLEGGLSAIPGYALGKVLKTFAKVIAYAILALDAIQLLAVGFLEYEGAITITVTVNYGRLTEISTSTTSWIANEFGALTTLFAGMTIIGVGFGGGLLLGLTR